MCAGLTLKGGIDFAKKRSLPGHAGHPSQVLKSESSVEIRVKAWKIRVKFGNPSQDLENPS